MFRINTFANRRSRNGAVSALAMALAFGGVAAAGTALTTVPAAAQAAKPAAPKFSKGFIKAYEPVAAIANAEGGDYAAAKAQIPTVMAAAENADDRHAGGSLVLVLGNKLNDPALQRQGLELMLASGKVAPEQVGQFNFFVGNLAYAAKDYAAARTALQAAVAAGYTEDNPQGLIAESLFAEGKSAEGLTYLKTLVEQSAAAGTAVPESYLLRGLKVAYDSKLNDQAVDWSAMLVKANPNQRNWLQALQVVGATVDLQPQEQLDLLRLMMATNSLSTRAEFTNYIETVDPRVMPNEASKVLAAAVTAGVLTSGDDYYGEVKRVVDQRLPSQAKEAADYAREANSASTGKPAETAGDIYYSMGDYAQAEAMYQMALTKGPTDRNTTLTRLGMVQALQGKAADARENLGQVTGNRASVARMWSTYADTKA
jgi:tetratricopeptide (TPR) repeat protein